MLVVGRTEIHSTISTEADNKENCDKQDPYRDVKHLLENNWTLWFFQNNRNRSWEDNQVQVATFGTVEDFWALYNHVERTANLPSGCDYSLFKQGIMPAWEDVRNRDGGRWLIQLDRTQKADTERFWMEILMMLIGEAFDTENEHICGSVVSIRPKFDKIAVWVSCNPNDARSSLLKIGQMIKDRLKLAPRMLTFETHNDTSHKTGANARASLHL